MFLRVSDMILESEKGFQKLHYRRQYIITPDSTYQRPDWIRRELGNGQFLLHHSDLNVVLHHTELLKITLLGYLLDPNHPADSDAVILGRIAEVCTSFQDVMELVSGCGGRFVLIINGFGGNRLFTDPVGFRQIYYSHSSNGLWCGSQPHLLAEALSLPEDRSEAIVEFLNSSAYTSGRTEHAWYGDATRFDGVRHLMPNHYLDIDSGAIVRFWPHRALEPRNVDEAAKEASHILQGILESAAHRWPLSLAVTAGWDSRVLLAASRRVRDKVTFFVQQFGHLKDSDRDIQVIGELSRRLNFPYIIEECRVNIDDEFVEIITRNVSVHQADEKIELYYNFFTSLSHTVTIGGNVSEIARTYYGIDTTKANAKNLAGLSGYGGNDYCIERCQAWLDEVGPVAGRYNVDLADLFYWEQRMGNWGAMFPAALDIAVEQLHPFNCRGLLETMLSVDRKYRTNTNPVLYSKIMRDSWPEVLSVPFYDYPFYAPLVSKVKTALKLALFSLRSR